MLPWLLAFVFELGMRLRQAAHCFWVTIDPGRHSSGAEGDQPVVWQVGAGVPCH